MMMFGDVIAARLALPPNLALGVVVFFLYSFVGYLLECVVLTLDKRTLVLNRGFVSHLPFCIIYGFGAMAGYALLHPFHNNYIALFLVGAVGATVFEFLVAQMQIRIFGDFWWDYNEKPFNYKGILCLESTIGWGIGAILVVKLLHHNMVWLARQIPAFVVAPLAALLATAYLADFAFSARLAAANRPRQLPGEQAALEELDLYKKQ